MPQLSLRDAHIHYAKPVAVYTAASGPVAALHELHLTIRYPRGSIGEGGARINIGYLTGRTAQTVRRSVVERLEALSLSDDPVEDLSRLDTLAAGEPTLRVMLSCALADAAARENDGSVTEFIGGPHGSPRTATNQTIFIGPLATVLAEADGYAKRGFRELKVRIGTGDPKEELELLAKLRMRLGPEFTLSADLNGAWNRATLATHLTAFADVGLTYLEQPLPANDLVGLAEAARASAVPIMLDESVRTASDVARIADTGAPFHVHLKLAKLAGLDRVIEAARTARSAGLDVMIGQMNEGALCTAAALAAAVASGANRAELYGADGVKDDPHKGLAYVAGDVTAGPVGLGVNRKEIWDG